MSAMTMAAADSLALHHDLLIELGRIEMALDSLDAQPGTGVAEKLTLRERLCAHRSRIHDALQRLNA